MKSRLLLHAALAMLATESIRNIEFDGPNDPFYRKPKPINTGRRAEKDAETLRKAQAKRDRKNAKRLEKV